MKNTAAIVRPLEPSPPASDPRPEPFAILLVTRDRGYLRWGQRWLRQAGFSVLETDDVARIPDLAAASSPTAVVLDARLIEARSWELYGALSQKGGLRAPVVILAHSDNAVDRALRAGVADVMRAPVDWRILLHRIASLTRARDASAELQRTRELLNRAVDAMDAAHARLSRRDVVDELTELPNRNRFERLITQALKAPRLRKEIVGVFHLDIDRFSRINDALGRSKANEVLRQVAHRLRRGLEGGGLVKPLIPGVSSGALGRISGDDFTVLVTHLADREASLRVATKLLDLLTPKFLVDDEEIYLTASVGIATAPQDGLNGIELMQRAEAAMKLSQRLGGGMPRFYDQSAAHAEQDLEIDRCLHGALERGELEIHYQPVVSCATGEIEAAEALLRWTHPTLGSVPPAVFIPVAERSGLMIPIGTWVIQEACRQLKDWLDRGLSPIRIAVNLSTGQLLRDDVVSVVRDALMETGLDPELLELELSERGTLQREAEIMDRLHRLKALGIRLSVDDFGTGDSAIVYLKQFPLDVLKIDRSYIEGMMASENDAAITSAIVAMAHQLRLSVIAEGVEKQTQLETLESLGCEQSQGFLFSPAVSAGDFEALLGESRT